MIDVENIIFTKISNSVKAAFPGILIFGEYVEMPASFPCITIVESDNRVYERMRDLDRVENFSQLSYTINIYTDDSQGKKSKAKTIANTVDEIMENMLFTRTFRSATPNFDRSIYRITMRYQGIVRCGVETDGKIICTMHTTR